MTNLNVNDIDKICTAYRSGVKQMNLCRSFHISYSKLKKILLNNVDNIRSRGKSKIFSINSDYFEIIDTEDKAYWLGFIIADGNVYKTKLTVNLASKDIDHLYKFKYCIKSQHNIHKRKDYEIYSFYFTDTKLVNDLSRFGVTPHKSLTMDPNLNLIPNNLVRHFWRGVFDGDGHITDEHDSYIKLRGSKFVCTKFSEWLNSNLSLNTKVFKEKNIHYVNFRGLKQVSRTAKLLYYNSMVYLDRKKETADRILEIAEAKGYLC